MAKKSLKPKTTKKPIPAGYAQGGSIPAGLEGKKDIAWWARFRGKPQIPGGGMSKGGKVKAKKR